MPTTPSTTTRISEQVTVAADSAGRVLIMSPVPANADMRPRQMGTPAAVKALHGYCPGVEFAAYFRAGVRSPFLFVGMPIDTEGAVSGADYTGNSGDASVAVSAGADGVLFEHEGRIRVKRGGAAGTDQIVLEYSLDGGRTYKPKRLGTALSFAIPDVGVTFTAGAGTLVAGDVIAAWSGSSPQAAEADYATVRTRYAAQAKQALVLLNTVDCATLAEANALRDLGDNLETAHERYHLIRGSVYDRTVGDTWEEWAAEVDGVFAACNSPHLSLSGGRGRRRSPWSGFEFRVPAAWAATIRAAQHDAHVTTWRRSDGDIGYDLADAEGQLAEYDDRAHGNALTAGRFTSFTTDANDTGTFLAHDLTRADDDSLLINVYAEQVALITQAVVQAATRRAATGETLVLKTDGSGQAEEASLQEIEGLVQRSLDQQLLADLNNEGPRASDAKITISREDAYNVAEPTMTTYTALTLRGVVHTIVNEVAIQR